MFKKLFKLNFLENLLKEQALKRYKKIFVNNNVILILEFLNLIK
jgi:hypothetical protein